MCYDESNVEDTRVSTKKYNKHTQLPSKLKTKSEFQRCKSTEQFENNCHNPEVVQVFSKEMMGLNWLHS